MLHLLHLALFLTQMRIMLPLMPHSTRPLSICASAPGYHMPRCRLLATAYFCTLLLLFPPTSLAQPPAMVPPQLSHFHQRLPGIASAVVNEPSLPVLLPTHLLHPWLAPSLIAFSFDFIQLHTFLLKKWQVWTLNLVSNSSDPKALDARGGGILPSSNKQH